MTSTLTAPTLYRSTIGKKAVMAVTGFILYGFVIAHMVGNLKFFTGESHFDEYAHFIRRMGEPVLPHETALWGLRGVLLASVILHIWSAVQLTRRAHDARPERYYAAKPVQSSYASRTMRWGGLIIFLFVIYHLLHMTTGNAHPDFEHGRVYDNTIAGFRSAPVTIAYTIAMVALGMHLYHGVWSAFQTLGRNSRKADPRLRALAVGSAVVVTIGFLAVPWAVLAGFGRTGGIL